MDMYAPACMQLNTSIYMFVLNPSAVLGCGRSGVTACMHCLMGAGSILLKLLTLSAGSDMLGSVHIQIQCQTISAQFQLHLSLQSNAAFCV